MAAYDPSRLEVLLMIWIGNLARPIYSRYANRLPLAGNERILEYGAGAGNLSRELANILLAKGGKLTCVDISAVWQEAARKRLGRYPNVEFLLGDISKLGLDDQKYDAVVLHFVLHEIPTSERQRVMQQLAKKLVPGGHLLLREPLREPGQPITEEEIDRLVKNCGMVKVSRSLGEIKTQGPVLECIYTVNS